MKPLPEFPWIERSRLMTCCRLIALGLILQACAGQEPRLRREYRHWPDAVQDTAMPSSLDGEIQWAKFFVPASAPDGKVPLVIFLHGWTQDWQSTTPIPFAIWCMRKGWAFMSPDFRGPFHHSQKPSRGLLSEFVIRDLLDARAHALATGKVDSAKIYLVGVSAGALTALGMAQRHPDKFAGLSVWVPMVDLEAWHRELQGTHWRYAHELEAILGGSPATSPEARALYRDRSPIFALDPLLPIPVDINAGIEDGRTGPVPVGHSLKLFNGLCAVKGLPKQAIHEDVVEKISHTHILPSGLRMEKNVSDYSPARAIFRKTCGDSRVTLFQGGHEIHAEPALRWLEALASSGGR